MFQWRIGFIDFGFNTTSLLSHGCVHGKVAYFAFDRFENLWPLRSRTIRNRHQTLKSDFSYRLKASNRSEIIIKSSTQQCTFTGSELIGSVSACWFQSRLVSLNSLQALDPLMQVRHKVSRLSYSNDQFAGILLIDRYQRQCWCGV